jgi:hypothetical protein
MVQSLLHRGEFFSDVKKQVLEKQVFIFALQTQISPRGYIWGGGKMTLRAGIIVSALSQMGDWNGMVIPLSTE